MHDLICSIMKQRFNILTLGVNDLKKAMKFYQDMDWKTDGVVGTEFENGAVVFFDLENGLRLSLYERRHLAWDSTIKQDPASATEFSIGHFVKDETAVEEILQKAKKAGGKIVKPAQKTFWGGYGGYFQDPDGHLWEIAFYKPLNIQD